MTTGKHETHGQSRPEAGRPSLEAALARALLALDLQLDGITYAAYLPFEGKPGLGVAMAVDTPCSFTIPTELDLQNLRQPTVQAYQTGEIVISHSEDQRNLVHQTPELFLHIPFPMILVSVPLTVGQRTFGCLNVRWSRTRDPSKPVHAADIERLREAGQKLAHELSDLAGSGISIHAPSVPKFIRSVIDEESGEGTQTRMAQNASGTTFLFQLKRLATELAAAVEVRDILKAARSYVMEPIGAEGLMLCRVQDARLRVIGSIGYPRDEVEHVEGMSISISAPEVDAILRAEAGLQELAVAFEGDARAGGSARADKSPQAYMPLIAGSRPIGCCQLKFPLSWCHYPSDEEIALAALMLGQIGQALERVYAHEIERVIAKNIQQSLLPSFLPLRTEAAVTSRYISATDGSSIGGDWYDVIPLPDDGIGLVIGDVEGHSMQAAGVMGHLRSAVLAYATEGHDPATILQRIDALLRLLGAARFATCCCLWLDPHTGVATVATAGHSPPLISYEEGQLEEVIVPIGPPLGLGEEHHYEQGSLTLEPDSVAVLYTDGLLDARALGPEEAAARLGSAVARGDRNNLDILADQLIEESRRKEAPTDDLALLILRYDGRRSDQEQDVARLSVQQYDLQSVASVRHSLEPVLARWQLEPMLDDMQLVLSEAVTNALVHAQSDVDIRLRRHGRGVRVEIQDRSSRPPVPRVILSDDSVNAEAESGRGLLIVDALCSEWGSTPAGWGKSIWIEMELPRAADYVTSSD